ncbi:hypothetical protein LTR53_001633 [Teratosphaeriaceae sp. CCFEE 6253]|nr:hypothetical protein LTR53_001633 [Teratosphaeriaceae sp. CCFEE 6253]
MSPSKPLTGAAFHDPLNTGPRPTHDHPTGGLFSIYAETAIAAPPRAVHDALLDINAWPAWNSFVPEVHITSHPHSHLANLRMVEGTNMIFHLQITPTERITTRQACSHIGELRTLRDHAAPAVTRIRWDLHNATSMVPGFMLKAQRVNEIEDLGDGRTWETFAGWRASHYRKAYEGALRERFAEWCRDLKGYVEGGAGAKEKSAA